MKHFQDDDNDNYNEIDNDNDNENDNDRHLLDGLGDAGVVESGGDGAVKSLSVGLPLADVPGQKINLKFLNQ